jgi:hypothetical protein
MSRLIPLAAYLILLVPTIQSPVRAMTVLQSDRSASDAKPNDVVDILAEKLALTDDQKTQIAPIIADRQTQLASLRKNTSLRRLPRAREAKRIIDESDKKILAILTPEQRQKYAAMEQEMHERAKERAQQRTN